MLGDTMAHDVIGANAAGMDTCLFRSGLHAANFAHCKTPKEVNNALKNLIAVYNNVMPTYLAAELTWGKALPDRKPGVYAAKLTLRNLIDEVNERTVTVDVTDGSKTAPVVDTKPAIVDFRVKSLGKPGEPAYAPATFQFQATADNGEMFIWDFGDGKGVQMGESQAVHVFKRPGTYPVKLIVFNNKNEKSVKEGLLVREDWSPRRAALAPRTRGKQAAR